MSGNSQEQERLKRLRERQLADRDPQAKQRQFQRMSAQKERRARKAFSLAQAWSDLPHVWRGGFYGVLLGTALLIILPNLWHSLYAVPFSAASIVVFAIFGAVLGNALDARDEIKNLMK